jgi:hypothetical protein
MSPSDDFEHYRMADDGCPNHLPAEPADTDLPAPLATERQLGSLDAMQ